MAYRIGSGWSELNELRSLLIFKQLEQEKFPRNKQMDLCKSLALKTGLDAGSISARVSNFKSVAGINNPSHASLATKQIFKMYGKLSLSELEQIIKKMDTLAVPI